DTLAVRAEYHAVDCVSVALQSQNVLACGRIPDLDRMVATATSDPFAVRTKRNTDNTVTMSREDPCFLARDCVPKSQCFVSCGKPTRPASAYEPFAVGTEGNAGYYVRMPFQRQRVFPCMPNLNRRVVASRDEPPTIGSECQARDSCPMSVQR